MEFPQEGVATVSASLSNPVPTHQSCPKAPQSYCSPKVWEGRIPPFMDWSAKPLLNTHSWKHACIHTHPDFAKAQPWVCHFLQMEFFLPSSAPSPFTSPGIPNRNLQDTLPIITGSVGICWQPWQATGEDKKACSGSLTTWPPDRTHGEVSPSLHKITKQENLRVHQT